MTTMTSTAQPHSSHRRDRSSRWQGGTSLIGLCGAFAVLATGCELFMQKPLCEELPACGGDPTGDWILEKGTPEKPTTSSSCSEDLYVPPTDTRLVMAETPAARIPPPEQALFDWCLLLVTNGGKDIQAKPPRFSVESPHVGAASVRLGKILTPEEANPPDAVDADPQKDPSLIGLGHYSVGTTRTGTFTLDFPEFCVRAFGARNNRIADPLNNPELGRVEVCAQLQVPVGESGLGEGAYRNTTCLPNPADITYMGDPDYGCLCRFDVSAAGGSAGQYSRLDHNTLRHLPNTNFPQLVNFCQQGDRLQLTGANGQYLFDQAGFRTIDLVRAPPGMMPMP